MEFGENLRTIREREGLTQLEVAEKMGLTRQGYARFEKMDRVPKNPTLKKLAEALGVSTFLLTPSFTIEIDEPFPSLSQLDFEKRLLRTGSNPHYQTETGRTAALLVKFEDLNEAGQRQAIDMLELLLKVPEYRKESKKKDPNNLDPNNRY